MKLNRSLERWKMTLPSALALVRRLLSFLPEDLSELVITFRGPIYYAGTGSYTYIDAINVSPSGRYLAQWAYGHFDILDLATFQIMGLYEGPQVVWSPDESRFAVQGSQAISIYPTRGRGEFCQLFPLAPFVSAPAWSSEGVIAIFENTHPEHETRTLSIWDPLSGEKIGHREILECACAETSSLFWIESALFLFTRGKWSYRFSRKNGKRMRCRRFENKGEMILPQPSPSGQQVVRVRRVNNEDMLQVSSLRGDRNLSSRLFPSLGQFLWVNEDEILLVDDCRVFSWNLRNQSYRTVLRTDGEIESISWRPPYFGLLVHSRFFLVELSSEFLDLQGMLGR